MKSKLIILFAFFVSQSHAQVHFESIKDVLNYADSHSFVINSSQMQLEISQAKENQSKSFLYPNVTAIAGLNDNITLQPTLVPNKLFNSSAPDNTYTEMTFGKQYNYSTGLVAQWDILNFQKKFALQTAGLQTLNAKIGTEKSRFDAYNQLASVYYSILLTQKSIEIFGNDVKVTQSLLENARDKYQKGVISESELNKTSIQHLQNEKNLESAQNNLRQYVAQLQSLLNTDNEIIVNDNAEKEILISTQIRSTNPDVLIQENQVKISKSMLNESRATHYPSLSIQYQYNYNWATDNFTKFNEANHLPSQFLGVKLSIPIFNGFESKYKVKAAQTQVKLQEMQLENTKLVTSKEDEVLSLQYDQSMTSFKKSKDILQLQEKNDAYSEDKYQSGIISLDQRMTDYTDLLTAQYNYLQNLSDFNLSEYKIFIRQMDYQHNNLMNNEK